MATASAVLKQIREHAGLTVRQLAGVVDMNPATYFRYENRYTKTYLPLDLIDRLEPVFTDFGVDPRYLRALEKDARSSPSNAVELPPLRSRQSSPSEKACVRRRLAHWKQDKDFLARDQLLTQYDQPIKALVTCIAQEHPNTMAVGDLVQEGKIAFMEAVENYRDDPGVSFEHHWEKRVIAAVRVRLGLDIEPTSSQQWQRAFLEKVAADHGPHQLGDRPIPVYALNETSHGTISLDYQQIVDWRRRPPALGHRTGVYGVYVPASMAGEHQAAGELVIFDAHRTPAFATDTGLAITFEARNEPSSFLCRLAKVDDLLVDLVPLPDHQAPRRKWTRGALRERVVLHRALKVQDLV